MRARACACIVDSMCARTLDTRSYCLARKKPGKKASTIITRRWQSKNCLRSLHSPSPPPPPPLRSKALRAGVGLTQQHGDVRLLGWPLGSAAGLCKRRRQPFHGPTGTDL